MENTSREQAEQAGKEEVMLVWDCLHCILLYITFLINY